MLNVGYCRVSTEEQASEGYSIDGQAEKLRAYAQLHDLGPVRIISDPGLSGKSLDRPGLAGLRAMVAAGEASNVLVWRLDRLSRSVEDLWKLANEFNEAGVGLHSLNERIDLSSATGRMFYTVLGAFAQFYREQLGENVRLGMHEAIRQGRHVNRAKFGYRMVDGLLVPASDEAAIVRRIFGLRAEGWSYRGIESVTGVKASTVATVLKSRLYLGEIPHQGKWYPGIHEALVDAEVWQAAQRSYLPGRRRSRHFLAGRVRSGICGRAATVKDNGEGRPLLFRCWHRGSGCRQPARSANGLERAAILGLQLLREDSGLRDAIRGELARDPGDGGRASRRRESALRKLRTEQRKLLELHYAGRLTAELFEQEERRLAGKIEALLAEQANLEREREHRRQLREGFEEVAKVLEALGFEAIWEDANEREKRVLVEELLESVAFFPDHVEVTPKGVPALNVLLDEVGLTAGEGDCSCRRGDLNPHGLCAH